MYTSGEMVHGGGEGRGGSGGKKRIKERDIESEESRGRKKRYFTRETRLDWFSSIAY